MGDGHWSSSRRAFLVSTGLGGVTALAGCSGDGGNTQTTTTTGGMTGGTTTTGTSTNEMSGSTLNLAISSTDSFDPVKIKGDGSTKITQQVFDTLTYLPDGSLTPEFQLANGLDISNGGTRYTFSLKEGVTYHNGAEMTAQDFVYSWERLAGSPNAQESKVILEGSFQIDHETTSDGAYKSGTLAVEALDDYTLQVDLKRPFPDALFEFALDVTAPIPEGLVGDVPGYEGEMDYETFSQKNPIGTGPYRLESFSPGTNATLAKFEDYYADRGEVDRIDMQILEDPNARYTYAINGNSDMFTLPKSRYSATKASLGEAGKYGQRVGTYGPLANDETVNYGTFPTNYTSWFIFNCNRVPRPVRRAVNYVANQETFLSQAFRGLGEPAYHYTPPTVFPGGAQAYQAHAKSGANAQTKFGQDGYPYGVNESRIDKARQVMEDAGYSSSNPYKLTFTRYTDRQPNAYKRIGQILRTQLQSAHVQLELDSQPFSAIIDGAINNNLDFFTLGNGLAYPSPADSLKFAFPNKANFTRWGAADGKGEETEAAARAKQAWQKVQNNLGPSDAAAQARAEAFLALEETNWHDAPVMLNYHPVSQQYWYDRVQTTIKTSSFHERQYDAVSIRS